jgi:hypothetical protein
MRNSSSLFNSFNCSQLAFLVPCDQALSASFGWSDYNKANSILKEIVLINNSTVFLLQ